MLIIIKMDSIFTTRKKDSFFNQLFIVFTCWILSIEYIASLKLNRLIIDSPVKNGSNVWLHCDFQLDDAERGAFTSKFYKNNIEFYRYSISSDRLKPTKKYFIQPAVDVNMNRSNGSHVFLENIQSLSEGTFSCEINTDEPFFMSMQAQEDLRVYVLPKKRLQLINSRDNYRDGDLVNLGCQSSLSKPPIALRWHINNQQIYKNEENLNITYQTHDQDSINGLSYTTSNLTFYLCTSNNTSTNNNIKTTTNNSRSRSRCLRGGSSRIGQLLRQKTNSGLHIRCTGVLSQIMTETAEELIIEEKGQNSRFEQQTSNSELLKPPKIQGLNQRYRIGDQLELNCSSSDETSLPAPYLEWYVNNRRINEQYVYNYANTAQQQNSNDHLQSTSMSFVGIDQRMNADSSKNNNKMKQQQQMTANGRMIMNSYERMPESNVHTKSSKSSHSNRSIYKKNTRKQIETNNQQQRAKDLESISDDKNRDLHNDYLFSNNLKKLNFLSFQQRNRSANQSLTNHILHNDQLRDLVVQQALKSDNLTLSLFSQSNFTHQQPLNNFNQQQNLYNSAGVNLTNLQNIIYQHYANYSFGPAQNRIGIRFKVMKKHYQTIDFALRIKCVSTYGKILWRDQNTIVLFADGRTSQYSNALEISCCAVLSSYSSFVSVILIWIVHLLLNNSFFNDCK